MINKQCVVFVNTLRKSHPHINYSNYLLYLPHTETMGLQIAIQISPLQLHRHGIKTFNNSDQ